MDIQEGQLAGEALLGNHKKGPEKKVEEDTTTWKRCRVSSSHDSRTGCMLERKLSDREVARFD